MKMVAQIDWVDTIQQPRFWLAVLLVFLLTLQTQLSYLLTGSMDEVTFHLVFWLALGSLLWQRRSQLHLESDPTSTGIGVVLIAIVLIHSWSMHERITALFAFLPMVSILGWALIASGMKWLGQYWRELLIVAIAAFPIIPLLPYIDGLFQPSLAAAKFTSLLMWYGGINVIREGTNVILPTGAVNIAGGCSGLNAMVMLLQLGLLFVIRFPISKVLCVLLPLASVLIAFVINSLRIILLVFLVAAKNMESFEYWHSGPGAQFFSLASMLAFGWMCQTLWDRHEQAQLEQAKLAIAAETVMDEDTPAS